MNKEQIYDQQINPLMAQIIAICKDNKIAMLATFDIPTPDDDSLACTTHLPDETGELPERIRQAVPIVRRGHSNLTLRTDHADGTTTMTAVLG